MKWLSRRWLALPIVVAIVASIAAPASADSYVFGPKYTTYMISNGVLDPTNIGFTSPPSADVDKNAQLQNGLDPAGICVFQAATSPNYATITQNFGGATLVQNISGYGNTVGQTSYADIVQDTTRSGQVMQDYKLQFVTNYIHGRSVTIQWQFAMQYGPNCSTDTYADQTILSS